VRKVIGDHRRRAVINKDAGLHGLELEDARGAGRGLGHFAAAAGSEHPMRIDAVAHRSPRSSSKSRPRRWVPSRAPSIFWRATRSGPRTPGRQQTPIPPGGTIIKRKWLTTYDEIASRPDDRLGNSRTDLETWLKPLANCTVYEGHARFETLHDVRVGEELLSADRIFLNVGGRALVPDMAGLDRVNYLTNTSVLDLDVLPRHLVIVGGGYVALEFAEMYRRFGSEVTVVEKGPRLIQREERAAEGR
jgi:Pyridine nucleotide-disulphide oxidoreductase